MSNKQFIALALILIVLMSSNFLWAQDHPRLLLTEVRAQNLWNRIISTDLALNPADAMWAKLRTEAEYTVGETDPNLFSTSYQ